MSAALDPMRRRRLAELRAARIEREARRPDRAARRRSAPVPAWVYVASVQPPRQAHRVDPITRILQRFQSILRRRWPAPPVARRG